MGSYTQTHNELVRRSRTRRLRNAMLNPIFSLAWSNSWRTSCRRASAYAQGSRMWIGGEDIRVEVTRRKAAIGYYLPISAAICPSRLENNSKSLRSEDTRSAFDAKTPCYWYDCAHRSEKARNVLHAKDRCSPCFVHPIHPDDHQRRKDTE